MTSQALIDLLIEKVSSGGNLLLDIGPTADGRIPVIIQQRLLDMGEWLNVNGEVIYGTQLWSNKPVKPIPAVYFKVKCNNLYVICTTWPQKAITGPGISSSRKVILPGSNLKVSSKASGSLTIIPPVFNPGYIPCQHAWVFKVENFRD